MLPAFHQVARHTWPLCGAIAHEAMWMRQFASGVHEPCAHLWRAPSGWVVPARYARLPGWGAARIDGELQVRASGGGLVPQGPGIWNLSLVWDGGASGPHHSTAVYQSLCDRLSRAIGTIGLEAHAGSVEGSFCDGRFNLAISGRKVVGTAQAWKRLEGRLIGLAHAVIVVDADPQDLADRANAVEEALGGDTRYRSAAMTSIRREAGGGAEVEEALLQAIAASMNLYQETSDGLA